MPSRLGPTPFADRPPEGVRARTGEPASGGSTGERRPRGPAVLGLAALLALAPVPSLALEAVGVFSRRPVLSYRALSPQELERLRAWNSSHPGAAISPEEASSLQLHFLKHAAGGREFTDRGFFGSYPLYETAREYEEAARALASGRADGRRVRRFRRRDGAVVTVDTGTGAVVVVAPTGRIKTFYNVAARCPGPEPAVVCSVSLHRLARWLRRRASQGSLEEVDYSSDPLAHELPLEPPPAPDREP